MQHGDGSIWGNHIVLKQGHKIMLNASSGKGKSTFTNVVFGFYYKQVSLKRFFFKEARNKKIL
jgi:ABC-type transport system involved in cytochrome bd biosynthesis fused ATPase/permease subunit